MFKQQKSVFNTLLVAAVLASSTAAWADNGPRGERRGGPPQAAFDACRSQGEGAICQFGTPRGNMNGTCRNGPMGMLCIPGQGYGQGQGGERRGPPPGQGYGQGQGGERRGPPQVVFDACQGRQVGAICEFDGPRGKLSGICQQHRQGRVGCVPAYPGKGGPQGLR